MGSMNSRPLRFGLLPLVALHITVTWHSAALAASPDDQFIAGYASAILEREFGIRTHSLRVTDSVIFISVSDLAPAADQQGIVNSLSTIPNVKEVRIVDDSRVPPSPSAAEPWEGQGPESEVTGQPAFGETKPAAEPHGSMLLPRDRLFEPLLADPRWPHFSASYRYYIDDEELTNVGAVNFGETFSLYRNDFPLGGQWELGIQGGVFAIFDFDAPSTDLVNADYFGGLLVTYRLGDFSALTRVSHQSSHLGDEYLLRNRIDRVNLSYEQVDLILSYDLNDSLRVYGGAGYIFHKEPTDLKPWSVQYGVEFTSGETFWDGRLRPVVAADFQHHEENGWDLDLSIRAGVQAESARFRSEKLQLLIEYFDGHSPNGQFYQRSIQYIGAGVYLYF
jgi:hypothetical protein